MKVFAVSIVWIKKVKQENDPDVPGIKIMNTLSVLDAVTRDDSLRKAIVIDKDLYDDGYKVHSVTAVEISMEIRQEIMAICSN